METEISRINSKIWIKSIIKMIGIKLISWPDLPNKDRSKWPAIILAESRIAKVNGRIKRLIDSIITIKGIKIKGVPMGVRCARRSLK